MLRMLLIIAVLFTGCGDGDQEIGAEQKLADLIHQSNPLADDTVRPYIEKEFRQYADSFCDDYGKSISISISFGKTVSDQVHDDTENDTAAICEMHPLAGFKRIRVMKSKWDSLEDVFKKFVIYHELGHCILGRGHTNNTMENKKWGTVPSTIMTSYADISQAEMYNDLWEYYVKELFRR